MLGDQMLMGGDVIPDRYEEPKGFSLSLQVDNTTEAERVFDEAGQGWQSIDATRTDFLGRAVRGGRGSLRDTMADQL